MEKKVIFRVLRFKNGIIDPPLFQNYELKVNKHMSVLDALEKIRLNKDSALMYRHSCHHSSCGTCACRINGEEKLACTTNVLKLSCESITLEPLDGFARVGDLVVDMQEFYADLSEDWNYLREAESAESAEVPQGIERFRRFENCIECGACVSACPVTKTEGDFMGPAALAALNREYQKTPHRQAALLALAGGERGERWCASHLKCSRVCPTAVYPARHIMDLRRRLGRIKPY